MNTQECFPFLGVVGQEDVKEALLISMTNPKTGGLLIVGEKGTAKSSLVRALGQVIPGQNIINLPLNATEDMVFGHIDLEYAVTQGEKKFSPGILGRAHGQVLYVDEINLLRQEIVSSLLDAADRGINTVEREGISFQHESKFTLIGTMNPEEGTLTSSVLDRFGLFACVHRETEVVARKEIMCRVLAYEKEPELFCQQYEAETKELIDRVQEARERLDTMEISSAMMELAAQYSMKGNTVGHRAELFLIEGAKAIAALAGRNYLLPIDMERSAFFVLPHRMRKTDNSPPQTEEQEEQSNTDSDQTDGDDQPDLPPPPPDSSSDTQEEEDSQKDNSEEQPETQPDSQENRAAEDRVAEVDKQFSNLKMAVTLPQDRQLRQGSGKRGRTRTALLQGRYVRSCLPKGKLTDLAFDATLRAAAPYQRLREKGTCYMTIVQEDLRQKVREKRIGNTFLFVVDASGSMGARERMRSVKGAIFSMLQDAYQKRDQVGLVAFRRETAEVLLPITRSVDLAQKCLQQLPTGGKTPLAEGLATALSLLTSMRKKEREMQPIIVLITDGRANRSVKGSGDAIDDALKMAEKIKLSGILSVVIDTEMDFIKLGIARRVASEMGATYYPLKELSGQSILRIVQNFQ
ncbi:VWA domain-containing protein [Pelosinus sp. sgz500959]|uniref:VWA domain-containing protein n=1 Tax=Pelosinus sp. sgz500959 TaxID=3242472 RepID=UPI0036710AED